jgi:hypothetical protein
MCIILTCINNYQEYIINNIQQLIKLGHDTIYVITNQEFFLHFANYISYIKLIDVVSLNDDYNIISKKELDNQYRKGFWILASLRFFYLYQLIDKYNLEDVFHLENDVIIYYNCNQILKYVVKDYIYIPFDSYERNIASILYIPNKNVFKKIIDNYNFTINDMYNFANIKKITGLIESFPIFINTIDMTDEQKFVSTNSHIFPYIFDAAAIGQYLGGVDPLNIEGDTTGFINETCVIKYNQYKFVFKNIDDLKKPFIIIDNIEKPIFNLHIHCKNLLKFM